MSYNFHTPPLTQQEDPLVCVLDAFEKLAADGQRQTGTYDEASDHVSAVAHAVPVVVQSLGPNVDTYIISVTGHANKGHKQQEGWSDEWVTIGITVKSYLSEDPSE